MQIIAKSGEFTYSYDSSVDDKNVEEFVEEYFPSVEEGIEAAMTLLWNIYDRKAIAQALKKGIRAMDYEKEG